MTKLTHGQILRQFKTKSGKTATLRIMDYTDVNQLWDYINKLSKEDTYIAYSGEEISLSYEQKFVEKSLNDLEKNNKIPLICEVDNQIASNCSLERNTDVFKRSLHIAVLGMSVDEKFRREGIARECMNELIALAGELNGVKIIQLDVFAENTPAYNLYKNSGFKEVAKLPKQYLHKGKLSDAIIMQYELTND